MYIETSVAPPNSITNMYTPWYWNDGQKCIQFFYHMYGNQIGKLTVYLRYSNSRYLYRKWSKTGNQNNTWHMGQVTVSRKNAYFMVSADHLFIFYLSVFAGLGFIFYEHWLAKDKVSQRCFQAFLNSHCHQ